MKEWPEALPVCVIEGATCKACCYRTAIFDAGISCTVLITDLEMATPSFALSLYLISIWWHGRMSAMSSVTVFPSGESFAAVMLSLSCPRLSGFSTENSGEP